MPTQTLGARQSASLAQLVRQAPPPPHWYGAHDTGNAIRQTPAPLQVRAGIAAIRRTRPPRRSSRPSTPCRRPRRRMSRRCRRSSRPRPRTAIADWRRSERRCTHLRCRRSRTTCTSPRTRSCSRRLARRTSTRKSPPACARRAGRLRPAASVDHAARHAIGGGRAAGSHTSRRCRTGTGRTNRWSSRRTSRRRRTAPRASPSTGARLRAADHTAGVHGARAGAVAGAVAHAAGDAVVGAFVARVGAHGAFMHVPTLPDSAHDWHMPVQSDRQQTSSKQKPLLQSAAAAHAAAVLRAGRDRRAGPPSSPRRRRCRRAHRSPRAPPCRRRRIGRRRRRPAAAPRPAPPQPAASNASNESTTARVPRFGMRRRGVRRPPKGPGFAAETALSVRSRSRSSLRARPRSPRPAADAPRRRRLSGGDAHQLGLDVRRAPAFAPGPCRRWCRRRSAPHRYVGCANSTGASPAST